MNVLGGVVLALIFGGLALWAYPKRGWGWFGLTFLLAGFSVQSLATVQGIGDALNALFTGASNVIAMVLLFVWNFVQGLG